MKKLILGLSIICLSLFITLYSCKGTESQKNITPVQFPDVAIQNFKFPEDSTTITLKYMICVNGIWPVSED